MFLCNHFCFCQPYIMLKRWKWNGTCVTCTICWTLCIYGEIVFMFALFQNSANLHNMSFIYFMLWEMKSTPVSQKNKIERHINIRDRQSKKTPLWSYVKRPGTNKTSWLDLNSLPFQSNANDPQYVIITSKHFTFLHPLCAICLYFF